MPISSKFLLVACLSFHTLLNAQQLTLSPNAEISVITIGPGTSLNDAFGHNAFRINDAVLGLDLTYGYGEYDFDAPYFYLKFAQGKLNYMISRIEFKRFYNFYVYQNRTMREQVLNLSVTEKQRLFNFLQNNYRPENRKYLYDFFYDNCATKIRDVLEKTSDSKLIFNVPKEFKTKTFRALIHDHVDRNSWGSMGIDMALGAVIDQEATPYQHMFLPNYIFDFFETANKYNKEPLVKASRTLYQKKDLKISNAFWFSPLLVNSLLALLIVWITYWDYKKNKCHKLVDVLLFGITGSIGVLVLLLWIATDHTATAQNYNLLWAFPLNLWVMFKLRQSQVKPWIIRYLKFLLIMLVLMTFHWIMGIEVFAMGLIPLLLALAIRYGYLIHFYNRNGQSEPVED